MATLVTRDYYLDQASTRMKNSLKNNYEIVNADLEVIKNLPAEVGHHSRVLLLDGEVVAFLSKEDYEHHPDKYCIIARSINNERHYRLYAYVYWYRKINGREIGGHYTFIDVGGMVQSHYDVGGQTPDADGKIMGARKSLIPNDFNVRLNSYATQWEMLTEFLSGKKVITTRSSDKLWFPRTVGRKPVPNEYRELHYPIYDFFE